MLELRLEYSLHFGPGQLFQSLSNFRKREMLLLKSANELEPVNVLRPVMSTRPARLRRWQQSLLDVVPNGPRADACSVAQLQEIDGVGFRYLEHMAIITVDSATVKYPCGPRLLVPYPV